MSADSIQLRFALHYPSPQDAGFTFDLDLELPGRGITGIYGASGSGKTTLLRCIAGLQRTQGRLTVQSETWQDEAIFLPPHQRHVGYVFQEHRLFPHLKARGNLQYAIKRAPHSDHPAQYESIVALLGIEPLLERYPHQLSGGECQRVAIARALLINPRLLLMDEPLSSLDMARKQEILPYLEKLRETLSIPVLYVSHSADEIARLADHLVVLDRGKAVASGALTEVLTRLDLPIRPGEDTGAMLEASVMERDDKWNLLRIAFAGGELWVRDNGEALGSRVRLRVLARDISLALQPQADSSILNSLPGKVTAVAPDHHKALNLVRIEIGASVLIARITRRSVTQLKLAEGSRVWAQIKSAAIIR
jgi:molybdate transport system ATP-binding protein